MNSDWDFKKEVNGIWRRRRLHPFSFPEPEDIEVLRTAKEHTSSQGARTDLGKAEHTWTEFCQCIGVPRTTANHWLTSPPTKPYLRAEPPTFRHKLAAAWYAIRNLFR